MSTVSLSTIRAANKSAGLHFFDASSMRFFRSKVESRAAHLAADGVTAYFVTSEQFTPSTGTPDPRKFTVRKADLKSGSVDTHGSFQGHPSKSEAAIAAKLAAKAPHTPAPEIAKPAPVVKSSIAVIGRRWFRRGAGGTYHTAEIVVDGLTVHRTPMTYGYGSSYEESAAAWLEAQGYITRKAYANGGHEPLWQVVRERMGLNWQSTAIDVSRERDL